MSDSEDITKAKELMYKFMQEIRESEISFLSILSMLFSLQAHWYGFSLIAGESYETIIRAADIHHQQLLEALEEKRDWLFGIGKYHAESEIEKLKKKLGLDDSQYKELERETERKFLMINCSKDNDDIDKD